MRSMKVPAALGQDLVYSVGERVVLSDELLEIGISGFGNVEIDTDPVILGDYLLLFVDIPKIFQAVDGLIEGVEGNLTFAHHLDSLHHFVGIHGFLAQHKKHQHFCCRFLQGFAYTGGGPAGLVGFSFFHGCRKDLSVSSSLSYFKNIILSMMFVINKYIKMLYIAYKIRTLITRAKRLTYGTQEGEEAYVEDLM